jgi:tetratricopeptide (TPR) repeat protein
VSDPKAIAGRPSQTLVELPGGVDLGALALSSEEGFVLSRVGKGLKLNELVAASGLSAEKAERVIERLLAKGALRERVSAAMAEEVELTPERKQEILALEVKLETANFFELLGLPNGAPADACKSAYYALSMRLHPDRYFGKRLGSFLPRIEKIFRRLTEAQQVLTEPARRAAYQQAHPGLFLREVEAPDAVHDHVRSEDRARRIARHPYMAKAARTQELVGRARKALQGGQAGAALLDLEQLLKLEPEHPEGKRLHATATLKHTEARGQVAYEEAVKLAASGDNTAALRGFGQALERAPTVEVCKRGMKVASELGDPRSAKGFAQKWTELEPRNAKARLALAEVLDQLGLLKNAKREAEEAVKLDPENKTAKALYAKLRWS